ncbi:hypothetical protein [Burkholderia lata]|uniref:hypothetical protein n=1 Tax=Burkholderia lata (strain ATCC 17760 / DSM 23089 / LMG 22485 / NCIMB 9086 / R18194 / 383) TaxID=482957 RepID=UPI0015819DFA|nr:hypothetical protein [Burkholderia lata]
MLVQIAACPRRSPNTPGFRRGTADADLARRRAGAAKPRASERVDHDQPDDDARCDDGSVHDLPEPWNRHEDGIVARRCRAFEKGGQVQFIVHEWPAGADKHHDPMDWLPADLGKPLTLDALARKVSFVKACASERRSST